MAKDQAPSQAVVKAAPTTVPDLVKYDTDSGEVQLNVAVVQKYFCPKANPTEAMTFMALCKYQGLNPWLREAYLVKYSDNDPPAFVVGKGAWLKRAENHPQYQGFRGGIVIVKDDGDVEAREGALCREGETLIGGWCEVFREDRKFPIRAEVSLCEYLKRTREGHPTKMWGAVEATMIRKVALVQAHREAFPKEYQGLVAEEEVKPEERGAVIDTTPIRPEEPLTNAEVTEQTQETEEPQTEPEKEPDPQGPIEGEVMDTEPSPEEQESIRKQEEAEAQPNTAAQVEKPKPPTGPKLRSETWAKVCAKAKEDKVLPSSVLKRLSNCVDMRDLNDASVLKLWEKLS